MSDLRETIIVVHGTWSQPDDGTTKWWQPEAGAGFIPKLDAALARRGSRARCWAHCNHTPGCFHWSGNNNWIDRTRATTDLLAYLRKLSAEGWCCHLVGHSHGGNVIADALHRLRASRKRPARLGKVVTLGTPYIDTISSIDRMRAKTRKRLGWIVPVLLVLMALAQITDPKRDTLIGLAVLCAIAGVVWLYRRIRIYLRKKADEEKPAVEALAISSHFDEAWQVLYHLREAQNPLAVKSGLFSYLGRRIGENFRNRGEVARLYGAASLRDLHPILWVVFGLLYLTVVFVPLIILFKYMPTEFQSESVLVKAVFGIVVFLIFFIVGIFYVGVFSGGSTAAISAYLWPFRRLRQAVSSVAILPGEVATYIARRRSWPLVQTLAMGLDGYKFKLPQVRMSPDPSAGAIEFREETLSRMAEERALAQRTQWFDRHLGQVADAFAKLALTSADIQALLEIIERDEALVHAAYYTDDECIERIADWIAGAEAKTDAMSVQALAS